MFGEKKRDRSLMASKLFDSDEYLNANKHLQAFTNGSGQLHHKTVSL
jgi:hypothetical protein